MNDYITLAHSTSAPVGPVRERLHGGLLALLYFKLREFQKLSHELDQLKRAIFYGKPEAGGNMTMPVADDENARYAFRDDQPIELLHAGLGLATESGEFLQAVAAHVFEGLDLDAVNIGEEIGDSLWYLAKAAKFTGTTLELEMNRNIAKLAKRFPDKFSDAAALNRDLDAERAALDGTAERERQEIELEARAIYDERRKSDPEGKGREWVDGGNSLKQDEARREARQRRGNQALTA